MEWNSLVKDEKLMKEREKEKKLNGILAGSNLPVLPSFHYWNYSA